jgi:hypothetical protein
VNKLVPRFNRLVEQPPRSLRVLSALALLLAALGLAHRRGWVVGAVAVIVYGGLALAMGVAPRAVVAWSRRHPGIDGAFLGPLLFLGLAYLTPLDIWWCAGLAVCGSLAGAALGMRRGRQLPDAGEPG